MLPPLKCISIILCQSVFHIERTPGHIIITRGFHVIELPHYPFRFGPITVLNTVTDGHGEYDLSTSLTHAPTMNEIGRWNIRQRITDPLLVIDVELVINRVNLPAPGKYIFDLKCNGEMIASRPFYANIAKSLPSGRDLLT